MCASTILFIPKKNASGRRGSLGRIQLTEHHVIGDGTADHLKQGQNCNPECQKWLKSHKVAADSLYHVNANDDAKMSEKPPRVTHHQVRFQ